MLKKKTVYIVIILTGMVLIALSFLFRAEDVKTLSGVLIGIGSALLGSGIAKLWMKNYEEKNPDIAKENDIEFKDERNTLIRYRAKAKAGDIIQWFIMGIAYLLIIIDAPLWVILVTVGIFLLYNVLGIFYMGKYQKEM